MVSLLFNPFKRENFQMTWNVIRTEKLLGLIDGMTHPLIEISERVCFSPVWQWKSLFWAYWLLSTDYCSVMRLDSIQYWRLLPSDNIHKSYPFMHFIQKSFFTFSNLGFLCCNSRIFPSMQTRSLSDAEVLLVACTRLYSSLCLSVCRSVRRLLLHFFHDFQA